MTKFRYIAILTLIILSVTAIFLVFNSDRESIEFKMMQTEHGWSFYKLIGMVPDSYKEKIKMNLQEENSDFKLYRITKPYEGDIDPYLYIKFKNNKEGFLKGTPDVPGDFLCSAINIGLFNEYAKGKENLTKDSIASLYVHMLGDFSAVNSIKRVNSVIQMRELLKGTSLKSGEHQDTIDLKSLQIDFDKEFIYWIPFNGFVKIKFNYKENSILDNVNCEQIGLPDATLLKL